MSVKTFPNWMTWILKSAAIYNIMWGSWVVLFPDSFFTWAQMSPLNHPMVWQGMGMVIGVYGLGYWWAAHDPLKHWPIVAVGFLGKIFGPLGFLLNFFNGKVTFAFSYMLVTNDLIWWIPFGFILLNVHKKNRWAL